MQFSDASHLAKTRLATVFSCKPGFSCTPVFSWKPVFSWQIFAVLLGWLPVPAFAEDDLGTTLELARSRASSQLDSIVNQRSEPLDPNDRETLDALRLILEFEPEQRHRFLLPRQGSGAKLTAARIQKLFGSAALLGDFRKAVDEVVESIDQSANQAEIGRDWELGYRLRWRARGLQAIAIGQADRRATKQSEWSHTMALTGPYETRKAFVNHPKIPWAAGSYYVTATPHFDIASQTNDRTTLELAELCEQTFAIWKQIFFFVWSNEQSVAPEYRQPKQDRFTVVLYRNRDAYIRDLKSMETNIAVSTGYYDPNRQVAFFYWDGAKTANTVVHELTHQFFYEASSKPVALDTDRGSGFWVVEGVALYMESLSLRACGGGFLADVGGWDSGRLQAGRYRRLHDQYWIPWDELHSRAGKEFRRDPEIRAWYSQAAGLSHFWLDGSKEQRRAFLHYIDSVYSGTEDPSLLGPLDDDTKLREAYDGYLRSSVGTRALRPFFSSRREAVLSRSEVKSQQLLDWPTEYRSASWLDLSFTMVDDQLFVEGDQLVEPAWNVTRWNLESTRITDRSLASLAANRGLVELDLSKCQISDVGLAALRDHKSLKILWLNDCNISDASIGVLLSLSQLETLYLERTKVSPAGWARLIGSKPRLKGGR